MKINQIDQKLSKVSKSESRGQMPESRAKFNSPPLGGRGADGSSASRLCDELSASLRRPSNRTLRLIDRALSYLLPFESPKAGVASQAERTDLLSLLRTHRDILSPYLNPDRIQTNLLK